MANTRKRNIILGIGALLLISVLTGASTRVIKSTRSLYAKIQLFSDIMLKINQEYVEEKDPQELIEAAIKGMVSDLDPHTTYLTAENFKSWNQDYEGYSGIGVTFDIIRDKITVLSVITDGPSEKVGLLAGDRIVGIEGANAVGIKRDEVPLKLMGPKGTKVEVTIEREGWEETRDVVITRDEVHIESVPYSFMIQPGVGYINIIRFSSTTAQELERALVKLKSQGMKQLILDLRNNAGGRLDAAVEVSEKFLPRGKRIVYTKGRIRTSFREFFSSGQFTHEMIPLVVLLDRVSASASEIVAGAMQDWDRGLILGEMSFGKGLVQRQYPLRDGSALFMTTARYYTPSGRLIQRAYDDKSLDDYYREVMSDSIRGVIDADDTRPRYKTLIMGRTVFGGGGISPDIYIKSERDTLTRIVRRIITAPGRLFFTFGEDYVKAHPEIPREFDTFLRQFKVDESALAAFLNHIRKSGFSISNEDYLKNRKDIQYLIKQTIAAEIWDNEARYKVQILRDKQLLNALGHFDEAGKLLARAYNIHRTD